MGRSLMEALDAGEWIGPELNGEYMEKIIDCTVKIQKYNTTAMTSREEMVSAFEDVTGRKTIGSTIVVFPFRCDFGFNIFLGKDVLVNYNCTFLDSARITIGDYTKIGPDCHLVTAIHPMDHMERRTRIVRGEPITIGDDCWIGANVTVLPGVTIGDRCVIGAGSVVTKDVPDDSVYAGNPARNIAK